MLAEELNTPVDNLSIVNELFFNDTVATNYTWEKAVMLAFTKRISLSEHAHYATPIIHFDKVKEKGHPFAYHVYGTAIIIVTVDCLRGIYEFDSVKIVHDYGQSMNVDIDKGQIEGGLIQGMGWVTIEELIYDLDGKLKSNALSTYKVPDIYFAPKDVTIIPLETDKDNMAILKSKAVGEPPLMYGIGAYFAIRNAILAFNKNATIAFSAPITPEKTLMALYSNKGKAKELANDRSSTVTIA